jgi:nucleoside-diphosphate-sugar epimerase
MAARVRALVTGASGFIGANLVRHLLKVGHEVIAVSRPRATQWRLNGLSRELRILELDLGDSRAIQRAVDTARPEWIFHLAAHGAYEWQTDLETMVSVNIGATAALLTAARHVEAQAFIHAGSSSEYGVKTHPPREDEWLEPNSVYAVTKAAATHLTALARTQGLPATTLRLYSIYGPWEDPGRLIPALVREALRGELPPLVSPHTARDFLFVEDCCDALVRAASAAAPSGPGAILNIGSGTQTRLDELVEIARQALDVRVHPRWGTMNARRWDASVWVSDPQAALEHLGWRASTGLSEGLTRTSAWLRAHPALWDRYGVVGI